MTIHISPELERQLRERAAREGVELNHYIVEALTTQLGLLKAARLKADEAELLQNINLGISTKEWERYAGLIRLRKAASLSTEEHLELIELSDRVEEANARRILYLAELARRKNITLEEVMKELGIQAPASYV